MTRHYKVTVKDGGLVIHCSEHALTRTLAFVTTSFGGRNITIEEV